MSKLAVNHRCLFSLPDGIAPCFSYAMLSSIPVLINIANVYIDTSFKNGAKRIRTADPLNAIEVLYQLSYNPLSVLYYG